jgi:hypothetical protein
MSLLNPDVPYAFRSLFLISLRLAALAPPLVDPVEDSFEPCGHSHTPND